MSKTHDGRTKESKDCWETPPYFFKLLDDEFHFTLDPCSSNDNHLCKKYYTIADDGLSKDWSGETVFVNAPYKFNALWVKKCYDEAQKPDTKVVMILPSRTDNKYWHNYIMKAKEIRFCKSRVQFLLNGKLPKKARCNFPLVVIVFGKFDGTYPSVSTYNHIEYKKRKL